MKRVAENPYVKQTNTVFPLSTTTTSGGHPVSISGEEALKNSQEPTERLSKKRRIESLTPSVSVSKTPAEDKNKEIIEQNTVLPREILELIFRNAPCEPFVRTCKEYQQAAHKNIYQKILTDIFKLPDTKRLPILKKRIQSTLKIPFHELTAQEKITTLFDDQNGRLTSLGLPTTELEEFSEIFADKFAQKEQLIADYQLLQACRLEEQDNGKRGDALRNKALTIRSNCEAPLLREYLLQPEFQKLKKFRATQKQLFEIPPEICKLEGLTSLDLSDNQIFHISEEISNLTNLTSLQLYDNKIQSLPESIGTLEKLSYCNLSINSLETVPFSLFSLKALKELKLSHNQIQSLPLLAQEIPDSQLKHLYLDNNLLEEIPEYLFRLRLLRDLTLSKNCLSSLPEIQNDQCGLKELDISHNKFSTFPLSVLKLPLEELDISFNDLTEIPIELFNHPSLKFLFVSYKQIDLFPPVEKRGNVRVRINTASPLNAL